MTWSAAQRATDWLEGWLLRPADHDDTDLLRFHVAKLVRYGRYVIPLVDEVGTHLARLEALEANEPPEPMDAEGRLIPQTKAPHMTDDAQLAHYLTVPAACPDDERRNIPPLTDSFTLDAIAALQHPAGQGAATPNVLSFYGSSDDLIYWEATGNIVVPANAIPNGDGFLDELSIDHYSTFMVLPGGEGIDGFEVVPHYDGTWTFSIGMLDKEEGSPFGPVKATVSRHADTGYSTRLDIEVPDGTQLALVARG